jgi:hypothetical protein
MEPFLCQISQIIEIDFAVVCKVSSTSAAPEAAVGCKPMFGKDAEVGKVGISISVEIPNDELPG